MNLENQVTLEDFARAFGTTVEDMSDEFKDLILQTDFGFAIPDGEKRGDGKNLELQLYLGLS